MIRWVDVYEVVVAMAPLYMALALGYMSVKWWRVFNSDHCNAINSLNCFFVIPFFTFELISSINPYRLNYLVLAADAIAKFLVILVLVFWTHCTRQGTLLWSVTTFSLTTQTNTLIVGVPVLKAMYGGLGADLVLQAAVIQSLVWLILLLFALELCHARKNTSSTTESPLAISSVILPVVSKLSTNPNSYACFLGLIWALIANRWNLKLPSIVEGCVLIMSKSGSGVGMFSMGVFIGLQRNILECGASVTAIAMILRFIVGPATSAIGCLLLRLHGKVLRIAIIQGALPQALISFVYAKQYEIHANVLSTVVTISTILSVPLLIMYYAILEAIH